MTLDWQNVTALIAVVAAGGYLAWRGWHALVRKRAGCGSCGSCPASEGAKTIVTIELSPRK